LTSKEKQKSIFREKRNSHKYTHLTTYTNETEEEKHAKDGIVYNKEEKSTQVVIIECVVFAFHRPSDLAARS